MSFKKLLTDRCDIYHLESRESTKSNYGVPIEDMQKEYYYPEVADHENVRSYFTENNQTVIQSDPNKVITEIYDVRFLKSANIQFGDKIIWKDVVYTARRPRLIRNHHIEVVVYRSENV